MNASIIDEPNGAVNPRSCPPWRSVTTGFDDVVVEKFNIVATANIMLLGRVFILLSSVVSCYWVNLENHHTRMYKFWVDLFKPHSDSVLIYSPRSLLAASISQHYYIHKLMLQLLVVELDKVIENNYLKSYLCILYRLIHLKSLDKVMCQFLHWQL